MLGLRPYLLQVWEEGSAFRELQRRLDQLQVRITLNIKPTFGLHVLSKVTRDDLERSKRERSAAAKKRGKVSPEDADNPGGVLAAQMPPPMEVAGQEQDEIWKLQAQVTQRRYGLMLPNLNAFCRQ